MATNIEQIFRSFVISKFREIQDQQFVGRKSGSQHNGEISSPDRVEPSDDAIPSIGNLQVDPLVQKIEQVLSEVLSAESQYKPDVGENILRSKSAKRSLSEEVQDEIPRKKSKKDKKHKEKKKKKKRKKDKKDKKYKKQSKESKPNSQEKERGELQHITHSESENSLAILSVENDMDMQLTPTVTQTSVWVQEKPAYVNTAVSNSYDTDLDRNRSDVSKEHSASVSIHESTKVEVAHERELENGPYQPTNLAMNLLREDASLKITGTGDGGFCMIRSGAPSIEETQVSSALAATEKVNVPENRSYIVRAEQEHVDTSLESAMLEDKRLDLVTESLNTESMKQSVSVSSEIYPQPPLESTAEAKDSVTALGFLAMVVGKDFEATSDFLNTAKVKASERSPEHISEMKNDVISDSERLVVLQDLQKTLQVNSRAELKDLPSSESQHRAFEKDSEPISVTRPKPQEEELKRTAESGAQKCMTMVSDGETITGMRKLRETQVSEIMTDLKDSGKSPRTLQTITDGKDVRRTTDLQITNRKYLLASVPDRAVEAKNTATAPLAIMGARNVEPSAACEKMVQMKCLEPFVEAVLEKKRVIEVNVPESIPNLEDVAEMNDLETISETADSVKPQNLEISQRINLQEVENEGVVNLKDLTKGSESLVTVKNLESIPESQYVKDVLQSTTVAQKNDFQSSLELEGEKKEKDIDATSDSLHMIFTNYSEPSLEPYTEPTFELKNSERVPELLVRVDTNNRKEQHIRESKELTSIESELNKELNDLEKIECLQRDKRNVKEAMKAMAAPTGKDSDILEAVPKGGKMDTNTHFVAGIDEKVSDICESMEKNQHDAETDLHKLSRSQKITKNSSERPGERMLFAKSKSLYTSESLQEMNILRSGMAPKLKTIEPMQGLKEIVGFAAGMEVVSPEKKLDFKISESSGSKDYSKFITTVKQVEPVVESHAEQNIEPLQQTNKNTKNINLGFMCDFDIKHDNANAEKWFSVELNNQKEKQTLEARSETAGMTTVPKLLYGSAKDPIIVSGTDEINRVIESECHSDSVHLGKINSENIVKPLYLIQMKDSQIISESRIVDVKALETHSGATFQAGAASADLREGELKVTSEIETTSESPKKNEISIGLQGVLVLQEPDKAFRNKALAFTNLDASSETHRTYGTENLEIPPQCKELEVKKSEGALPFVSVVDMVVGTTDKGKLDADTATEIVLTTEKSRAPTESADMLEKTFDPTCMANLKYLEASQKLKTHLESLDRKEMNYVFSGSSTVMNASETLKNEGRHVLENVWKDTNKVKEKHSGTDLESDAALVVKNSESILESITVSEKKDGDTSMTAVKVTDLETSSSNLDTRQTSNLKTTLQIETTSRPVCTLQSRDSDSVIESVSKIKTKDLGQGVNAEKISQVKDSVTAAEQLNTLELKSLTSTSGPEVTDCAEIPDLKTTPRYLVAVDSTCSSTVAEMKALEAVDSGTHLKPENTSEINLSETTLEIDKERHDYVAVSRSEAMIEEASELVSEIVCLSNVEVLKSTSEPKHVEIVQSSEKQLQLLFKSKCPAITVESANMSDLRNASTDIDPISFTGEKYPKTASEIVSPVGVKNSKPSSEVIIVLNDKEPVLQSGNILQFADSVESKDFEASNKCVTLEEVGDLHVASVSTGEEVQMVFEGTAKTVLDLESQKLEQSSTSEVLLGENLTEVTVESSHAVCTKDSEPVPEHISAKNIDISEQHSKCLSIREVKDIESSAKYVILTEAKFLEVIPQFIGKMKDSETTLEQLNTAKEKDLGGIPQVSLDEEGLKTAAKPVCTAIQNLEANEQISFVLKDSEAECVQMSEKDLKAGEKVFLDAKDTEPTNESLQKEKDRNLKAPVEDSLKDHDSEVTSKSMDITKEDEESTLKDKKSEKISSKTKDKSKSGKKTKKSRSKSLSKSKKRKKKTRSRSLSRLVSSRRARSRSKNDSDSKKKHSTSRHKSRSKSADRKEKESSLRSKRTRSRSPDRLKSRSKSVDKRDISVRSRRRRSKSSDHRKSRSRSVDRKESVRRRRRLSRSSDNHRSRSRSVDRRETLIRSRRRRSRSSDRKSRSQSADRREISVRRKQRRSLSSDRCKSRSRSLDRRESSIRTRRRRSRSSDHHRSRSADDKRASPVRTRRRRSRSPDTRKSRSRSFDRRARRRRSRSSDNRKSRSRSADRRETLVRVRRRRSRSSDNRRSKSKSVDKRETPLRARRRRSRSSDNRRSKSKSIDRKETPVRPRRRRSVSSDRKSRSKSIDKRETSVRAKRRRSKSPDDKSGTKSVEKGEPPLKPRRRRSKSLDHHVSRSKSRSPERKKDKESSDGSREKHTKYRSKSKSLENTERTESVEATVRNRSRSPEHKSKSRSRSKSIDKTGESQSLRRSRSKSSKSPETRSHRRRTVSRSRKNRSRSLTRKRASRSKSNHRSRTHSRTRSRSCPRRWRRTRSRSTSRQRSLSRERRRRSRRNRSRSVDRRRRRSDSRDSYRLSLRLRSRSRTPAHLRCSRSIGRRRSPSKSPDHRRSSSRSPKRLTDLDKAQLLEIAKANAAAMCAKAGVPLPPNLMPVVTPEKKEEKVTQKSAKETILELTEKCKKIAQSQDDVIVNKPHVSDEEEEEHPFINHPFKLNEPKPIFFNLTTPTIKPAAPKNQVTLTKEFPVSSGSQHRKKEADSAYGEWVPVEKDKDEKKDDVFPNPANLEPVDISSALTERTIAQKRLTENTFDLEAMCLLNRAQERIDAWAELNTIPGHFTGSTGAQVLTSEQLANSGPQAWVKKDQFLRAAPVRGGMGAQLMRKMGWREGEGLGKNKEGNREPILVDFKTDRKGLVAIGEKMQKRQGPFGAVKDLSGKHPVSALLEVCNKRRWSPPVFVLMNDSRPENNKNFLFKVMVNGVEYKPSYVSPNKKHAKATAATVALQTLGLVPKDLLANATNFRSASHS